MKKEIAFVASSIVALLIIVYFVCSTIGWLSRPTKTVDHVYTIKAKKFTPASLGVDERMVLILQDAKGQVTDVQVFEDDWIKPTGSKFIIKEER